MAYLDFKQYGGKFKAVARPVRNVPGHFMNVLHKKHVKLLSTYLPEQPVTADLLSKLQVREIYIGDSTPLLSTPIIRVELYKARMGAKSLLSMIISEEEYQTSTLSSP